MKHKLESRQLRSINNLRCADDTTLKAENEGDEVKEENGKGTLKFIIQKTKILASCSITSWQINGETVIDFNFSGSKITADGNRSHAIKRHLLLGRKVMTNLDIILKKQETLLC